MEKGNLADSDGSKDSSLESNEFRYSRNDSTFLKEVKRYIISSVVVIVAVPLLSSWLNIRLPLFALPPWTNCVPFANPAGFFISFCQNGPDEFVPCPESLDEIERASLSFQVTQNLTA